jgi:hypothetical protein
LQCGEAACGQRGGIIHSPADPILSRRQLCAEQAIREIHRSALIFIGAFFGIARFDFTEADVLTKLQVGGRPEILPAWRYSPQSAAPGCYRWPGMVFLSGR